MGPLDAGYRTAWEEFFPGNFQFRLQTKHEMSSLDGSRTLPVMFLIAASASAVSSTQSPGGFVVVELFTSEFTDRQRLYAEGAGGRIYTPQMVLNGTEELVGSRRGQVLKAVERALAKGPFPLVHPSRGRPWPGFEPTDSPNPLRPARSRHREIVEPGPG